MNNERTPVQGESAGFHVQAGGYKANKFPATDGITVLAKKYYK